MRTFGLSTAMAILMAIGPARGDDASPAPAPRPAFEQFGLSLPPRPAQGKIPVVFIHGLWLGPNTWGPLIRALEADPDVSATHQFWTFGYATGDPIPYSARLLRMALDDARSRLDPGHLDPALDRIVVVGHSMGGVLAKMMVVDSGERFWRLVSDHEAARLAGDPDDVALARDALIFRARPEIQTVVFIATPHRGSAADQGVLHEVAARLAVRPGPFLMAYRRLIAANPPEYFRDYFRARPITSIDELRWGSPLLQELLELRPAKGVELHSIIPIKDGPRGPGGHDGVVAYTSAHLEGVASEALIPAGHFCQDAPATVAEIRRILRGSGRSSAGGPISTCDLAPTSVEPGQESREVGLIFGEERPDNRL